MTSTPARERELRALDDYPTPMDWRELRPIIAASHQPGEHAALLAPTQSGKSHLWSRGLAPMWSHTLTLDGKLGDPKNRKHAAALRARRMAHYPTPDIARYWGRDPYPDHHYWIEPKTVPDCVEQFRRVFDDVFAHPAERIRTIYVDEFKLMASKDGLGLGDRMVHYLRYAAGRGITLISATQSPRYNGPESSDLYDQCRWFYLSRTSDKRTVDRYGEIGGFNLDVAREVLPRLQKYEWWVIGLNDGISATFTLPGPKPARPKMRTRGRSADESDPTPATYRRPRPRPRQTPRV